MTLEVKSDMGEIVGHGIWTFPDSMSPIKTLDCTWKDNNWHGSCVFNENTVEFTLTPEGDFESIKEICKDGSWENLLERTSEGHIRVLCHDGTEYKGEQNWLIRSGYARGVCKYPGGTVFDGEWEGRIRHGNFTVTSPEGIISTTTFKDDVPIGHCIQIYPDGEIVEFKWQNGTFTGGHIKVTFQDKSVYEGDCDHNAIPNRQGTLTLPDGKTYSGIWKNGRFDDSGLCIDLVKMWGSSDN
jgi:hypothetical protein